MGPRMIKVPPPPTNKVKLVKFKVSRPDGHYGLHKMADTEFKVGMGPCGRHVAKLEVFITDHLLRIVQHSTPFDITEALAEYQESSKALLKHHGRTSIWSRDDRLPASLVEFHEERKARCKGLLDKAHDDMQVKEFVYKITDVHGRIETLR